MMPPSRTEIGGSGSMARSIRSARSESPSISRFVVFRSSAEKSSNRRLMCGSISMEFLNEMRSRGFAVL